MSREFFKNLPDTTTPLNAQRMNSFLNGNEAMGSIVVDDISCKNLFNINNLTLETGSVDYSTGIITVNQYANSSIQTLKQLCPDLIVGETYTLSLSTTSTDSKFIYLHGSSTPWINGTQRIITQADLDGTIGVYGVYDSTDTFYISNIQIEKGTTITEYTPYKSFNTENCIKYTTNPLTNIDFNNYKKAGQYSIYGDCTNGPVNNIALSVLEVLCYSKDWIIQRLNIIATNGQIKIYKRCFYMGTTWSSWEEN